MTLSAPVLDTNNGSGLPGSGIEGAPLNEIPRFCQGVLLLIPVTVVVPVPVPVAVPAPVPVAVPAPLLCDPPLSDPPLSDPPLSDPPLG